MWLTGGLLVIGLSTMTLSIMGYLFCRKIANRCASLETTVHAQQEKLATLVSGAVGMGHRIVTLEKRLQKLGEKQGGATDSDEQFAYGQAIQMFEQGADPETVASNCGFSNSEAQLMAMVQEQIRKQRSTESESS